MASQTISSFITKVGQFGSTITRNCTYNPQPFQTVTHRYVQGGPGSHSHQDATNVAKRGINEALRTGENLKNKAAATTDDVVENTKETTQSIAEKAKQAAQGAWESAKETAQKTKDTVLGKADEAKETVKETTNRNMNTNNKRRHF